jgi:hypothetical protein
MSGPVARKVGEWVSRLRALDGAACARVVWLGLLARLLLFALPSGEVAQWQAVGTALTHGSSLSGVDASTFTLDHAPALLAWSWLCAQLTTSPFAFAALFKVPALVGEAVGMWALWSTVRARHSALDAWRGAALLAAGGVSLLSVGLIGSGVVVGASLLFCAVKLLDEEERPLLGGVVAGASLAFTSLAVFPLLALVVAVRTGRARGAFLMGALVCALPSWVAFDAVMPGAPDALAVALSSNPDGTWGLRLLAEFVRPFLGSDLPAVQGIALALAVPVQAGVAVALGLFARRHGRSRFELVALVGVAVVVLAPCFRVEMLVLPALFLVRVDRPRALLWALSGGVLAVLVSVDGTAVIPRVALDGYATVLGAFPLLVGLAFLRTNFVPRWRWPSLSASRQAQLERHAPWVLFALWCVVTVVTVLHHEPWRDEADTWLVARDLTLAQMWKLGPYVGTPLFWHVLEVPFAKAGLSYGWEEVLHWPLAAGMAALIAFRAPFSWRVRGLWLFSYFFVFEYAVVARGYALTCLLIFLACALHPRRHHGSVALVVVLVLAANTTPFGLFFVIAWQAVTGIEFLLALRSRTATRAYVVATLVGWAGTLLALAQLFPRPIDGQKVDDGANLSGLTNAFSNGHWPAWGNIYTREAMGFLCLLSVLWLVRRSPRALGLYVTFAALLAYLFGAKHVGFVRHWGYFDVDAIAALWIARGEGTLPRHMPHTTHASHPLQRDRVGVRTWLTRIAVGTLVLQGCAWVVRGGQMVEDEWERRFSNAPALVTWLKDNHLDTRIIAAHPPTSGEALLPYLPHTQFFYPALDRMGTSMPWDEKLEQNSSWKAPEVVAHIRKAFPHADDPAQGVLLLLAWPISHRQADALGYRLLHVEDESVCSTHGERFWLYAPTGKGRASSLLKAPSTPPPSNDNEPMLGTPPDGAHDAPHDVSGESH